MPADANFSALKPPAVTRTHAVVVSVYTLSVSAEFGEAYFC